KVFVGLSHSVWAVPYGRAGPDFSVHFDTGLFEFGPHTAIDDNGVASTVQTFFEPIGFGIHVGLSEITVHGRPIPRP
ncbi:MAG: hypothetical protein V3V86_02030, partial [Gammaproteobacteria bacterium]